MIIQSLDVVIQMINSSVVTIWNICV